MTDHDVKRGQVWWVVFDPAGGGMRKTRAAIILSNQSAIDELDRLQVVPVSASNVASELYPCEAWVTVEGQRRKAVADQIATVSRRRLRGPIGTVSDADLEGVERAVRVQLGLEP